MVLGKLAKGPENPLPAQIREHLLYTTGGRFTGASLSCCLMRLSSLVEGDSFAGCACCTLTGLFHLWHEMNHHSQDTAATPQVEMRQGTESLLPHEHL